MTKRPVPGEYKFFDISVEQSSIGSTGTIAEASILTISQGTSENERIGRRIILKHIELHYFVTLPAVAVVAPHPNGDLIRIILYLDKQCNKATATVANIMQQSNVIGFYNLTNVEGRFEILMDRTHEVNYNTVSGTSAATFFSCGEHFLQSTFSAHLDLPILYNTTDGGTVADLQSNNIGVLLFTRQNNAEFESVFRVRFLDN